MTNDTAAALAAAIDARTKADMAHLNKLSGPFNVVARIKTLPEALADRRWGGPAMEFAATARFAAIGQGPPRACFCCDRAWSPRRLPALLLLAELWTAQGFNGLVSGICGACASRPDLARCIGAGFQRDLGADSDTLRIIEREEKA